MKKLFLAAEAKHPESINKLTDFVGGSFKKKKIVYIPTAANGEKYGSWKMGESYKVAGSLTKKFKILELEDYAKRDIRQGIGNPDILWMAGGQGGYLLYWIRRVKLDKYINELLENGTAYVGSSAGSMVCSITQIASENFIGEEEPGASLLPGLGLINFEIYPHYEEKLLPQIKKFWKKGELYLLKNGEVITEVDNKIEVLGDKRILKNGKVER